MRRYRRCTTSCARRRRQGGHDDALGPAPGTLGGRPSRTGQPLAAHDRRHRPRGLTRRRRRLRGVGPVPGRRNGPCDLHQRLPVDTPALRLGGGPGGRREHRPGHAEAVGHGRGRLRRGCGPGRGPGAGRRARLRTLRRPGRLHRRRSRRLGPHREDAEGQADGGDVRLPGRQQDPPALPGQRGHPRRVHGPGRERGLRLRPPPRLPRRRTLRHRRRQLLRDRLPLRRRGRCGPPPGHRPPLPHGRRQDLRSPPQRPRVHPLDELREPVTMVATSLCPTGATCVRG